MKQSTTRIVIYPKDVQAITGKADRAARRMLQCIRKENGKGPTDLVSLEEFCRYTGLREEEVQELLT